MRIHVAHVAPDAESLVALDVPSGATVADAIALSHLLERIPGPRGSLDYAIFGRRVDADTPLADGDRVEITRPLQCDPKLARRNRALTQASATSAARRKRRTGE